MHFALTLYDDLFVLLQKILQLIADNESFHDHYSRLVKLTPRFCQNHGVDFSLLIDEKTSNAEKVKYLGEVICLVEKLLEEQRVRDKVNDSLRRYR